MSAADELRRYLSRLLGWTNTNAIEDALRSLDLAREHRAQLVLCRAGDPDLRDLRAARSFIEPGGYKEHEIESARRALTDLVIDAREQPNRGTWRTRKRSTKLDISAVVRPEGRLLVVTFIDAQPYDPPSRTSVGRQGAVRGSPKRDLVHVARLLACRVLGSTSIDRQEAVSRRAG
jgi:hypothetical protein